MAQTPNIIGLAVMQRLKETGEPATPENYARHYHAISGIPPAPQAEPGSSDVSPCMELIQTVRGMVQEVTDKTASLAQDLGEKNKDLADNVVSLKGSRDRQEILRLLSTVVLQAGGIQNTVESSHKELLETRQALSDMQAELAETRQLLNEDALTGALNRRGLDQTLVREIARVQRSGGTLSLCMVDLDFFKTINDDYGHEAGDLMLIHFTSLIKAVLRKSDAVVRYGGEEFTLILPDTDTRGAMFVLGRLRQLMRETPLDFEGRRINTTFSAGIACLREGDNGHAMLHRADAALYAAKQTGRDTFKLAD